MTRLRTQREETARVWRLLIVVGAFATLIALALYLRSPRQPRAEARLEPPGAQPLLARPGEPAHTQPAPATDAPQAQAASDSRALTAIEDLRSRFLTVPVDGITPDKLVEGFRQPRGKAAHEALDIPAARGTPVMAVEAGRVAKLFTSQKGGLTIYQFDPTERYAYYYAHLDAYADGVTEGRNLRRGELIGYVGTTGNAPENAPHLHFAIFELSPEKVWWKGEPIDPFLVWRPDRATS